MKLRPYTAKFPPRLGDIVQMPDGYCGLVISCCADGLVCGVYEHPHSTWCGIAEHLLLIHRPKKTMFVEEEKQ